MALFHSFFGCIPLHIYIYVPLYMYICIYISHLYYLFHSIDEHLGSKTHGNVLAIEKSWISYNVFAVANEKLPCLQTISVSSCARKARFFFFLLASGWGNATSSGHWRYGSDVYLVQAWDLKFLEKSALFLSFHCQLEAGDPKQCSEAYRIQQSLERWVGPMPGLNVSRDMLLSCYASEVLEGELTQECVDPIQYKGLCYTSTCLPLLSLEFFSYLATLVLRYASASGPLHLLFVVVEYSPSLKEYPRHNSWWESYVARKDFEAVIKLRIVDMKRLSWIILVAPV